MSLTAFILTSVWFSCGPGNVIVTQAGKQPQWPDRISGMCEPHIDEFVHVQYVYVA
jgi:hypothetical protein